MKVSLSWLNDYVPIGLPVDALAEALTMAGLEVEAVEDRYAHLQTVVVGRVLEVLPHPNADRLRLCRVDGGDDVVTVVCGAPNVAAGMLAPLARVGTPMPDGSRLERSVIRGQPSEGMLCSAVELGLGTDGSGMMELDAACAPGTLLSSALDLSDHILEIGLTPNRPDCLSMIGVAREVAAIQNLAVSPPDIALPAAEGDIHALTSVTIAAPDHCPRYAARLLADVTVAPSPHWLQDRLRSVGVRPINNLVDVTNFVMLETGQPLHAFDFDNLAGHRIVVRTAAKDEPFTTLDQKARRLDDHMLMICDGEKAVAVGGVMGGLNSEIEASTRRVLIESACFDPVSVRRTSKALGLSTDASHRFERGVDPDGTLFALNRAAALMAELSGGRLIDGIIDEDFRAAPSPALALSVRATNQLLGTDLGQEVMAALLRRIGFTVQAGAGDDLSVQVPSFRVDVARPQDLMEEVARLSGYHRIPTTFPALTAQGTATDTIIGVRHRVREILCGFGFSETISYSFISAESADRIQLSTDDRRRRHVALLNPISEEMAVMRTSLIPGMLETAQRNIARQQSNLRLFEIGKVFLPQPDADLPQEKEMLVGLWTGLRQAAGWHTKDAFCDFYDIKGVVQGLVDALGVSGLSYTALPDDQCAFSRPGHSAIILHRDHAVGIVGEVDAAVKQRFVLRQPVFVFEMDVAVLDRLMPDSVQMMPIPRFPATSRDITVIVDRDVEALRLLDAVNRYHEPLVEDLSLFDVFADDPIPADKKSISFRIVYRSAERTLDDETVNTLHQQLTQRLIAEFGAALPA